MLSNPFKNNSYNIKIRVYSDIFEYFYVKVGEILFEFYMMWWDIKTSNIEYYDI